MRRLFGMASLAAIVATDICHADPRSFTLSSGYNETALTSDLNRSTALQTHITHGRQLYLASIDNHGLASIGVGRISSAPDFTCHTDRYPVLTVFAQPRRLPGLALTLHQEWYWRGRPTRAPAKYLTVFRTEGGVVCQDGELPKVRVAHRFESSQRRFPGRSQGVEWVWEFRRDFPTAVSPVVDRGGMTEMVRRTMRYENWAFFSRECGPGVLRLNVGATHKTVFRPVSEPGPSAQSFTQVMRRSGTGQTRIPVVMVRFAYTVRRW